MNNIYGKARAAVLIAVYSVYAVIDASVEFVGDWFANSDG